MYRFRPQLVDAIPSLDRRQLVTDITAGIIVGIVALPLAIAFAIASGLTPERGLTTAIIAGAIIAALGGSRVQIGGPTGAFVVLVASIVQRYGIDGLLLATLMAGVILIVGGLLKAGALIRYIPLPVTLGFTTGIALVIAAGQVFDALGLAIPDAPAAFLPKLPLLWNHITAVSWQAVAVTAATLATIILWPARWARLPGPFVALVLTTAAVALFDIPIETIGSRFGELPRGISMPRIPQVSIDHIPELIGPAFTIALLGAIESLLSAVVADSMTGQRHRANTELVAQGIANVASPLFGGMPATGAIARTATNIRSGAGTPIAGITHAVALLVILLAAGPLAADIPMATLAGILLVVAWKMADASAFMRLATGARADAAVLLTTFAFTVLADLTVGITVGVSLAALLFVQRMTSATEIHSGDDEDDTAGILRRALLPPDVRLLEVRGPLFFGAADKLRAALDLLPVPARVLLIDLDYSAGLDVTTTRTLADFANRSSQRGSRVIFITHDPDVALMLRREGLERSSSIERAVARSTIAG